MFRLPDYFDLPEYGALKFNDITMVKYRRTEPPYELKFEVFLSCYLFAIILEGDKIVTLADRTLRLQSGEAFFLNRGVYGMSEILNTTEVYSSLVFFIEPHFIDQFIASRNFAQSFKSECKSGFKINSTPPLQGFVHSILPYFSAPQAHIEALLPLKIQELLHNLCDDSANPDFIETLSAIGLNQSHDIAQIMEKSYSSNLQIKDYAKLAGKSLTKFKDDFKSEHGIPPGEWIRKKRLSKAKVMLEQSQKNISEICAEVGYQNISNFILKFKEEFGSTPKQMAKNGIF